MFPQVDPIPLPAPVWLFKVLEILTVTLHFLAVQLLLGGLLVAVWWSVASRQRDACGVGRRGGWDRQSAADPDGLCDQFRGAAAALRPGLVRASDLHQQYFDRCGLDRGNPALDAGLQPVVRAGGACPAGPGVVVDRLPCVRVAGVDRADLCLEHVPHDPAAGLGGDVPHRRVGSPFEYGRSHTVAPLAVHAGRRRLHERGGTYVPRAGPDVE